MKKNVVFGHFIKILNDFGQKKNKNGPRVKKKRICDRKGLKNWKKKTILGKTKHCNPWFEQKWKNDGFVVEKD